MRGSEGDGNALADGWPENAAFAGGGETVAGARAGAVKGSSLPTG